MEDTIVFGGMNSLDFFEVRTNVMRIPEVSIRIEQAQRVWDKRCGSSFSLHHFLNQENINYFNNINVKALALAVVQLGLFDRYLRNGDVPKFIVGNTQADSAAMVAAGQISYEEMIASSGACTMLRPMSPLTSASVIELKGRTLPQFQAFEMKATDEQGNKDAAHGADVDLCFQPSGPADMNLQKVLQRLIDDHNIQKIVNIGPGVSDRANILHEYELRDIQIVESIDADPMLNWFWPGLRQFAIPIEQAQ